MDDVWNLKVPAAVELLYAVLLSKASAQRVTTSLVSSAKSISIADLDVCATCIPPVTKFKVLRAAAGHVYGIISEDGRAGMIGCAAPPFSTTYTEVSGTLAGGIAKWERGRHPLPTGAGPLGGIGTDVAENGSAPVAGSSFLISSSSTTSGVLPVSACNPALLNGALLIAA